MPPKFSVVLGVPGVAGVGVGVASRHRPPRPEKTRKAPRKQASGWSQEATGAEKFRGQTSEVVQFRNVQGSFTKKEGRQNRTTCATNR